MTNYTYLCPECCGGELELSGVLNVCNSCGATFVDEEWRAILLDANPQEK